MNNLVVCFVEPKYLKHSTLSNYTGFPYPTVRTLVKFNYLDFNYDLKIIHLVFFVLIYNPYLPAIYSKLFKRDCKEGTFRAVNTRSSAYIIKGINFSPIWGMLCYPFIFNVNSVAILYITILNNNGDNLSPCFTPVLDKIPSSVSYPYIM